MKTFTELVNHITESYRLVLTEQEIAAQEDAPTPAPPPVDPSATSNAAPTPAEGAEVIEQEQEYDKPYGDLAVVLNKALHLDPKSLDPELQKDLTNLSRETYTDSQGVSLFKLVDDILTQDAMERDRESFAPGATV